MNISIIKYNAGNTQSVLFALERLGINAIVTDDVTEIGTADKVIFPGVGEAGTAMNYLRERNLDGLIVSLKQPVLGICLGMQLLCKSSEEGSTKCLGIFDTPVKLFSSTFEKGLQADRIKVPQMGWNTICDLKSKLFTGIKEQDYMYFVHSYYAELSENTIATTHYGHPYSSALQKNNFYGVQFHPEKSAGPGQKILENFITL